MAKASFHLIQILNNTARNLRASNQYQWGHMGLCNCGFLAQEITHLRKEEIHAEAMSGHGDWNEQLNDYCPTSGLPMDDLISELLLLGFDIDDLKHLERLSSPLVLSCIPFHKKDLQRNKKDDVVLYMEAWAKLLEEQLISNINIDEMTSSPLPVVETANV
jgi:hypothetical protein